MTVYGFNRERSSRLRRLADRVPRGSGVKSGLGFPPDSGFQPGIPFLNSSGETAPAYGVMRITDDIEKTSTQPFGLVIGKPNASFQGLYLVNGPDAVADGGVGTGYFYTGDYPEQYALYNSAATPAPGQSWSPVSGSWLLHQHGPGFFVLGGHDGTKVSIIQSIPAEILVKRTAGDLAINTSGTFEVWGGVAGSEANSGQTVTAYNKTSITFKDEKFGAVGFLNGQGYAVPFQT